MELVRGEDEFVGPSFKLLDAVVSAARSFEGALHGGADSHNLAFFVLGLVDNAAAFFVDKHLFRVHFVLRKVFHVGVTEVS